MRPRVKVNNMKINDEPMAFSILTVIGVVDISSFPKSRALFCQLFQFFSVQVRNNLYKSKG